MSNDKRTLIQAILRGSLPSLLAMGGLALWAWVRFPADVKIPIHWNVAGEIDRYAGKAEGLLFLPVLALILVAVFAGLSQLEPRRNNLKQSAKPLALMCTAMSGFLLLLYGAILALASGIPVQIPRVIVAGLGGLLILIGHSMHNIQSNFMLGIRTPWTLSSELSWTQTHRLGRWLFMLAGLLVLLSAFWASPAQGLGVVLGSLLLTAAVTTVYSYRVWKNDPNTGGASRR